MADLTLTGYTGSSTVVNLPTTIDGNYLTSLASDAFLSHQSITAIYGGTIKTITSYTFNGFESLSSVSFPECEYIGDYAFIRTQISIVSFPKCSYVGSFAFNVCYNITEFNLPKCTHLGPALFYAGGSNLTKAYLPVCSYLDDYCLDSQNLSEISLPECSYIGNWALRINPLKTLYAPKCSYIGDTAVAFCPNLETACVDACEQLGQYTFYRCSSLKSINLPMCKVIKDWNGGAFEDCISLSMASLPVCSVLYSLTFRGCTSLKQVYLLSSNMVSVSSGNPFSGCTALKSIYIPYNLTWDYNNDSFWSQFSSMFVPYC